MEFGSDYVYMYEEPSFEYISDEEYEAGMNISDSDDSDSDDEVELKPQESLGEGVPPAPLPPQTTEGAPPPPPQAPSVSRRCCAEEATRKLPKPPVSAGMFCAKSSSPVEGARPCAALRHHEAPLKKKVGHWRNPEPMRFSASGRIPAPPPPPRLNRRVRQGDTNVVTVKFDKVVAPSNMHAGDPQECSRCSAILSKISRLEREGDQMIWTCEFCETRNVLDIEEEERPVDTDVTYMLEPALSTTASGPTGLDESLVVFCVDISGSMCVTTEVPGHIELRGAPGLRRAQQFNRERADQYLPHQRRNVTYISRLQSVQAAIDHQLEEMAKEFPNRRVCLVTFSNEVTVIGDGKGDPVSIAGDKLTSKDTLRSIAAEQPFPDAIKNSRQHLGQKLFDLEECGPTALGPALLVSATIASRVRGSKVILCTDGLANVGMGKLDNFKSEEEKDEATKFYMDVGEAAVDSGVSVSVITIKGTDCKLVEIGKIADRTGGQVNIVDPLKLTQEFSTILANKIIATNVVATFILHKDLFFFYEDSEESKVVKNIGNVTADTEISFEYGVRTKPKEESKEKKKPDARLNTLHEVTQELTQDVPDAKTEGSKQEQPPETEESKLDQPMETSHGGTPEHLAHDTSALTEGAEPVKAESAEGAEPMNTESSTEGAEPIKAGTSAEGEESLKAETSTEGEESVKANTSAEGEESVKAGTSTEGAEPMETPEQPQERSELPFQLQVRYTDTEGAKALRVITQTKPVTRDRRKAERLAKVDVLARHTAMTTAKMAEEGMYSNLRERALMNQRVAWRHTKEENSSRPAYKKAFSRIRTVENYFNVKQQEERASRGRTYSDDEDDDVEVHCSMSSAPATEGRAQSETTKTKGKKTKSFFSRLKKNRSETTSDFAADLVFKGKKPRSFFEDSD